MYRTSLTAPVFGLRREIDRLFEDTFNAGDRSGWVPPVNIRESGSAFAFEVELAGLKPEQVEVTCDNSVLMIRGERQEERKEGDEGRYHLVERTYGTFSRSFQLPQGIDEEGIEASFENGLLRVRVPKAALPQPRRIDVRGARSAEQRQEISGTARGGSGGGNGRKASASDDQKQRGEQTEQKQRGEMAGSGSH